MLTVSSVTFKLSEILVRSTNVIANYNAKVIISHQAVAKVRMQ